MSQCSQCGKFADKLFRDPKDKHRYGKVCSACRKMLKSPIKVTGANGKECEQTTGMCACCGLSAGSSGKKTDYGVTWYVFKAGWCDSDGVYYPRLCGGIEDGICIGGCIQEVVPREPKGEDIITELLGDDLDGAQAMAEDLLR